jgi:uncharacterized protein
MIAFGLVVATGYAVQTTLGLGGMVLCVTLGAHLFPLHHVLALAVPLSVLQTSYVTLRHHDGIDFGLLLRRVLPLMGTGVLLGLWIGGDVDQPWLRTAFALLVLGLALRELWVRTRQNAALPSLSNPVAHAVMLGAGIVHGLYATGGPLLVYALGRRGLDKRAFRSTLTAVWLTMNVFLCIAYAHSGRFDRASLTESALLSPAVPIGIVIGERLHRSVDERRFQIAVFVVLAVAAAVLLVR